MDNVTIEGLKKDLYRYKTLYEIGLEENKLLKEQILIMQQELQQRQQFMQQNQEQPQRSIVYRGLRKIYRMIKR